MKTCSLLAVDDTADNLFLLEQVIEAHLPECEVVSARCAREGLVLAAANNFDAALIDVQMPDMDGLEMCRRLKNDPTTSRISVLLITAKGSTARQRAEALVAGADDFVSRPIDNDELVARIRVMLRLKQAEKQLAEARDELEQRVVERTADLAAANQKLQEEIAERKWTEAALQRALGQARQRGAETSALLSAVRAVLEERSFPAAARSIYESCKTLIGATCGYVSLASADGGASEIAHLDSGGLKCELAADLPMPIRGLRAEAYRTGHAVYDNNFPNSPHAGLVPPGHSPLDNVLFAPLRAEGCVVGLLGLGNKPGGFTNDDARMASAFGEFASIALCNSKNLDSLENSEKRFRSVVETASDAILYINQAGKIVFCNQASCAAFGYDRDEMLGRPLTLLMPEAYRPAHHAGMARFLENRQSTMIGRAMELVGLRKDGGEFPMELSIASWETDEGCFFTGIIRDITARKQAEAALREIHQQLEDRVRERTAELTTVNRRLQSEISERERAEQALRDTNALLERVFATTQMSLAYLDADMRFVRVNRAYAEQDHQTPEFFVGKAHFELYPDAENETVFRRVIQSGEPVEFYGKPFVYVSQPERGPTYWDWSLHPVKNETGQVEGLLLCLIDVTKREQAELRARQHQMQLAHVSRLSTMGEMGSAIAHELNQPLCAILASAQASLRMLKAGKLDPAVLEALEQVAVQAKRAGDIIRHLRDFTSRRTYHRSTIQLAEVVREAANFVAGEARPHRVTINLDVPDNLPPVLGDTIQIEQVLVNLMRNGIEAMENTEGTRRLDISVRRPEPDMVEFAIRDTGRGLPEGDCDRVFEPFFSTKPDGMGVGLAVSRSIVEFHGGRLWAVPGEDGGSIFKFVLPGIPAGQNGA